MDNDYCFACGTKNPLGLQLAFENRDGMLSTTVRPKQHWQGWAGIVHGGLQSTIFDDLMSNHQFRLAKVRAATVELTVRFKRPVPLDQELVFTSQLVSSRRRIWELKADCRLKSGPATVLSVARGKFMEVPTE